jgi:hypothetical protein
MDTMVLRLTSCATRYFGNKLQAVEAWRTEGNQIAHTMEASIARHGAVLETKVNDEVYSKPQVQSRD